MSVEHADILVSSILSMVKDVTRIWNKEGGRSPINHTACKRDLVYFNGNQPRVQRYGEYSITRTSVQLKTCKGSEQLPIAPVTYCEGLAIKDKASRCFDTGRGKRRNFNSGLLN